MQINSSLTALGNLLAQITADNAQWSAVTEAIAAVQSISAVTPDADGRNTVVVVGATGYSDTESFTYTRRGLGDSVNPAPTAISLQGTETAADVAKLVASALGLVQSEVSFNASFINADGTITQPAAAADGTVTGSIAIVSASGSLLYVDGSTLSLAVNFPSVVVTPPVPTLAALTQVTALSGFSAAAAPVASTDGTSSTGTATDGTTSTGGTTPPAADGTSSTGTTGTDGQAAGGTTAPAADGTGSAPAADGTTPTGTTPAADGTTSTPSAATDGTAAAGTTPAADGTTTAPAATDGATPAAPAADGQASQAAAS
jgi:hypothetical protein